MAKKNLLKMSVQMIPMNLIALGTNSRAESAPTEENTATLKASIRSLGLIQPLAVYARQGDDGKLFWELAAGYRRMFALKSIYGKDSSEPVPCSIVQTTVTDPTMANLGENFCREGLTPAEVCRACDLLTQADPEKSAANVGRATGMKPGTVAQYARVHRQLDKDLFFLFASGHMTLTEAITLAASPIEEQRALWEQMLIARSEKEAGKGKGKGKGKGEGKGESPKGENGLPLVELSAKRWEPALASCVDEFCGSDVIAIIRAWATKAGLVLKEPKAKADPSLAQGVTDAAMAEIASDAQAEHASYEPKSDLK